jgi:hypothetical protein
MLSMLVAGLTLEDSLARAGNWSLWKARIVLILDDGRVMGDGASRESKRNQDDEDIYSDLVPHDIFSYS